MKLTIIKGILIAALSCFSGLASAFVYEINLSVGTGSAFGTITTNDTFGVLSSTDILDWNIALDGNPGGTFTLFGPASANNSSLGIAGTSFIASADALLFNFSSTTGSHVLFQNPTFGSGINYLCFDDVMGACSFSMFPSSIHLGTDVLFANISHQTGLQVIASIIPDVPVIPAIPEPETYAMLLLGLGLISFMARRKKSFNV